MHKRLSDCRIIFLVCVGRSGSGFFHSLLDSHPNILTLPMELKYYEMWGTLDCDNISTVEDMAQAWCENSKLRRLQSNVHYGFDKDTETFITCDFSEFRNNFENQLRQHGLNRSAVFLSIHGAYAQAVGRDTSSVTYILSFEGQPIAVHSGLEDFPNSHLVETVRDPRGNFASIKQHFINTRGCLVGRKDGRIHSTVLEILDSLIEGFRHIDNLHRSVPPERRTTVRLEDLHLDLDATIRYVAHRIGFEFDPCLLESTLGGRMWRGNSSFSEPVLGVKPEIVTRWKNILSPVEIEVIEIAFSNFMRKWNYEPVTPDVPRGNWLCIWRALSPIGMEFTYRAPQHMPGRHFWKSLWKTNPKYVHFLRGLRAPVYWIYALLVYPSLHLWIWRKFRDHYS